MSITLVIQNNTQEENIPSDIEQHIHMIMFLGQGFDLVLLSYIHNLGLNPCWRRGKKCIFCGEQSNYFNACFDSAHMKKRIVFMMSLVIHILLEEMLV